MNWYVIRTVYLWGHKNDGTNVFEERVVACSGKCHEEALARGKDESQQYSDELEHISYEFHLEQVSYVLDSDDYVQGQELWSELFQSNEDLDVLYANRYKNYEYVPD